MKIKGMNQKISQKFSVMEQANGSMDEGSTQGRGAETFSWKQMVKSQVRAAPCKQSPWRKVRLTFSSSTVPLLHPSAAWHGCHSSKMVLTQQILMTLSFLKPPNHLLHLMLLQVTCRSRRRWFWFSHMTYNSLEGSESSYVSFLIVYAWHVTEHLKCSPWHLSVRALQRTHTHRLKIGSHACGVLERSLNLQGRQQLGNSGGNRYYSLDSISSLRSLFLLLSLQLIEQDSPLFRGHLP